MVLVRCRVECRTVRRGQIHPRRRPERLGRDDAMRHAWQTEGKKRRRPEQAAIDAANLHHRNRGRAGDSWRHAAREGLRAKSVCANASLRPALFAGAAARRGAGLGGSPGVYECAGGRGGRAPRRPVGGTRRRASGLTALSRASCNLNARAGARVQVDLIGSRRRGEWPLFAHSGRLESTLAGHRRSRLADVSVSGESDRHTVAKSWMVRVSKEG